MWCFKEVDHPEPHLVFVCSGDQTDKIDKFLYEIAKLGEHDRNIAYLYDPISKYMLLKRDAYHWYNFENKEIVFQLIKHAFNVLNGITYPNIEDAKKFLGCITENEYLLEYFIRYNK